MKIKKIVLGMALIGAMLVNPVLAGANGGKYEHNEDNDLNISDNQVVIVQCIQNGVVVQTDSTVIDGSDEVDETPAVENAKEAAINNNCTVNVIIKSDVEPTVTPTVTPVATVTATPTPVVVTNTTNNVREVVREVTKQAAAPAVIPAGAPATGHGGN